MTNLKQLNNAVFILRPLLLKTFTKNGLNIDETITLSNTLEYFDIEYEDFNYYLENVIYNFTQDSMDEIIDKINAVRIMYNC